ncbi:MAG: GNAT family N-acetyltransferase [Oscillospiraceae bacterium]|nr:GNAT family N-acetyltransferase [Oscillospiraceae bacterium]
MDDLILTIPTKEHEKQVMKFREEMQRNGEGFYGCSGLDKTSDYDDWLDFEGRFVRLGWTPSTTYLGIRASDGMLIGMIDLRHELSGFLLKYNGQIGYSVRPSERRKGYATQMLLLVLKKAEVLGYEKVLVCCKKANVQSARVIQKCGGVLENEVVHEYSPVDRPDIIQRYWIKIDNKM